MTRTLVAAASVILLAGGTFAPAAATGTAKVWQRNGTVKTYNNVAIRVARQELALTTRDGVGTLVIGRAACTKAGALVECLPYDATLFQNGWHDHIKIKSGTVWLNPTTSRQLLPDSSAQIPPHGVLVSLTSKAGTYLSVSGTADEIQK